MSTIFTSTMGHTLKKTLDAISMDKTDGLESSLIIDEFMKVESMSDRYVDDLSVAGPGLFPEKPEGEEIEADTIREEFVTRYLARTFAKKILITEEAMEDNKYEETIDTKRMLKRALYLTVNYDGTMVIARGWNSAYVGGDGQPLFSASHPLAGGGTYSNLMATPMSPSTQAVAVAQTMIYNMPGHDGLVQTGLDSAWVMFPNAQWQVWAEILKSDKNPVAGNFATINAVKSELKLKAIRNPFWTDTTTRWVVGTNADNGLKFKWRRKPRGRTWTQEDNQVMVTSDSARWARGWTNPRCVVGVNA